MRELTVLVMEGLADKATRSKALEWEGRSQPQLEKDS